MVDKLIRGAGGGGGKGGGGGSARVAQEAPDSLRSRAYAQIIDLVSEGEIEGLVNGLKSVYLDDTPIQNADGSTNFTGITLETRNGTQSQSYIPGFSAVENEQSVGLEVKTTASIVRTVTNSNVNAVRVTMAVPSLTSQNKENGDISGTSVQYKIQIQTAGGGYVDVPLGREGVDLGSGTQIGSGRTLYDASVTISWTGDQAATSQSVSYKLQKSKNGGAWVDVTTGSLSGTGNYSGSDEWGYETVAPSGSTSVSVTLDGAAYNFRILKTGGSGSVSISGSATAATPTVTISGKTTSRYERSHRIELTGSGPWDIKAVRLTADSTSSALSNKTYWASYTEVIDAKLRYPNSALIGLRVDSSQFSSIPSRSYDMKLLKVQVPTNYDPITRAYTGSWDGTFKIAWTDNPAWCFYDLLTSERYGLGKFVAAAQVDKWALYQIAKYCDELVPNGFGGFEPRFTCNVYIQGKQDAYKVVQDFASCFRAMTHWATNSITAVQDSPSDPVALFTNANVIDGTFSYQGSSAKARHTVALVRWNDPDDLYRQKVEYVEDRTGIDRYGYIETDVVAFGCTSRGQANRVGRWLLFSERLETESVAFKTGLEGAVARPGQIIKVADKERAGTRQGGRVSTGSTTLVINVDQAPTGSLGGQLSVVAPDGSVQTGTVTNVSGNQLTVSPVFSTAPVQNAIWILSTKDVESQTFRVMAVVESGQGEYEITGIAHDPEKYGAVERGLVLEPRTISTLSSPPPAPDNLIVTESLYESRAEVRTRISASWDFVPTADSYLVSYKLGDGNFVNMPATSANYIDIDDVQPGFYTIKVVSQNAIGKKSTTSTQLLKQIFGKTLPPVNVAHFSLIPMAGNAMLSWDLAPDLDVQVGGYVRIRYTPLTTGQDWNNAVDIMPALPGTAQHATAPLLNGTYMAKFVDSSGNQSVTASQIVTTVPYANALNVVQTYTESPTFPGVKTGCIVGAEGLELDTASTVDQMMTPIDTWPSIDSNGGLIGLATYDFANTLDLGAVYPTRLTALIQTFAFDANSVIDARLDLIDAWLDIDGAKADNANASIYMRTTADNTSGAPTWTEWKPFFVGEYSARGFQFQARLTTADVTNNVAIQALTVTADMPDRVESMSGLVSGTGSYHVTFPSAFMATPTIGITAQAMASGDYYEITGKSASGFDIIFKNSGGTAISRTFDVLAKGYGRRIS